MEQNIENTDLINLEETTGTELMPVVEQSDTQKDYEKTRDNLYDLIDKGKDALEIALNMVKETESPRTVEVFSTLLKTLADTNIQLLDIQKKRKDILEPNKSSNDGSDKIENQTINQTAIFTGSTSELGKLLKNFNFGENTYDNNIEQN